MELIEDWFAKKADRAKEIISIYEGILSKDFYIYIFFRLQYFLYSTLIKTGIRAVEFYFLFYFVTSAASLNIVLFRMLGLILSGLWWGILESLRTQLRLDRKTGEREKLPVTVQYWLTLSFCVAAAILFLGILVFIDAWTLQKFQLSRLEYFYAGAILIQLAVSIVVSTVHSSIFALTRINRPLLSVSMAQIIGLIALIALYPITKEYTLAIAYVIEGVATITIMLYYTLRMDRVLMLLPKAAIRWEGFLNFLKSIATPELFLAGLASLLFALQPLFIYLIIEEGPEKLTYSMAMLIFLIAPQINETFNWTHLFYFDMKKLAQPGMRHFEQYMHDKLKVVAFLVGLGAWVISAVVITLFYPHQFFISTLLLLPIFLVRSWNAHREMQFFCDFHYLNAIISGLVFAVCALTWEAIPHSMGIVENLIFVLCLFLLCSVFLYVIKPITTIKQEKIVSALDFHQWLSLVKSTPSPVCLFYLQLNDRSKGKLEHILIRRLSEYGLVCSPGRMRLLVAWNTASSDSIDSLYVKIISLAAGHIVRLQHCDICSNGSDAIQQGINNGFLPAPHPLLLSDAEIISNFKKQFPDGQFVAIDSTDTESQIHLLTANEFGGFSLALRQHFRSPYELGYFPGNYVLASTQQGQISHAFIIPENKVERSDVVNWKNYLLSNNVTAVL
jgi:hypothetical protein